MLQRQDDVVGGRRRPQLLRPLRTYSALGPRGTWCVVGAQPGWKTGLPAPLQRGVGQSAAPTPPKGFWLHGCPAGRSGGERNHQSDLERQLICSALRKFN